MENELYDIKKIFGRRKKGFFVSFTVIFLIGIIIAIALPPIYKSESIIRLEDQQISEEFVRSTIPEYIGEQIARISQQVLNRDRLAEIVNKLNLFSQESEIKNTAQVVDKMKQNIFLEAIEPDIPESQSQRKGQQTLTIAFKLSYQGDDHQAALAGVLA